MDELAAVVAEHCFRQLERQLDQRGASIVAEHLDEALAGGEQRAFGIGHRRRTAVGPAHRLQPVVPANELAQRQRAGLDEMRQHAAQVFTRRRLAIGRELHQQGADHTDIAMGVLQRHAVVATRRHVERCLLLAARKHQRIERLNGDMRCLVMRQFAAAGADTTRPPCSGADAETFADMCQRAAAVVLPLVLDGAAIKAVYQFVSRIHRFSESWQVVFWSRVAGNFTDHEADMRRHHQGSALERWWRKWRIRTMFTIWDSCFACVAAIFLVRIRVGDRASFTPCSAWRPVRSR